MERRIGRRRVSLIAAGFAAALLTVAIASPAGAEQVPPGPEAPAETALMSPGSSTSEVVFAVPATSTSRSEGGVAAAAASSYTCLLTVDNPHWSNGSASVIAKSRVRCKGPSGTIPVQVQMYLGKTAYNDVATMGIVAQSLYTQYVQVTSTVNWGPTTTWYVPALNSGTHISRAAYFRASASANTAPPLLPLTAPPSAASSFLWVP